MRHQLAARRAITILAAAALSISLSGCPCPPDAWLSGFFCRTNESPKADLSVSQHTAESGSEVTLSAEGSSDPDGEVTGWLFDPLGVGLSFPVSPFEDKPSTTFAYTYNPFDPGNVTFTPAVTVVDDDGGTSRDQETVTVVPAGTNKLPNASISAFTHSSPGGSGGTAEISYGYSDDDGQIVKLEWDLDGNGEPELPEPPDNTTHGGTRFVDYDQPGHYRVGFRVTDDRAGVANAYTEFDITPSNRPPTAVLTVSPNPARINRTVTFSAEGSADSDGTIGTYLWDLDGSPGYETDTHEVPTVQRTYTSAQELTVRLRVLDNENARGNDEEVLTVQDGGMGAGAARAPSRVPFTGLIRASLVKGQRPVLRHRGTVESMKGVKATGRLRGRVLQPLRGRGAPLLRRLLRSTWRGDIAASVDTRTGKRKATVLVLAKLKRRRGEPRAPTACVRLAVGDAPFRKPSGSFKVLGGTGAAARLVASGNFGFEPRADTGADAQVSGVVRARSGRPRGVPAACRRLAR